jgi:hypothetical protein
MKGLELGDGVQKKHDEVRNFEPGSFVGETFEDKDWSELRRFVIVHCEAALASYAKYGHLVVCPTTGDETSSLGDLSTVRSRLLVSNLICV